MKYLLVCGCARSGNTLMSYLCATGFDRVYRHPGEENPLSVDTDDPKKYDWIVSKRPKLEKKIPDLVKRQDFYIIYMLRDPRAVLVSHHPVMGKKFYTPPERWIESAERIDKFKKHDRVMIVKFEDLVLNPMACQKEIAARFGLVPSLNFDECYKNFEALDKNGTKSMHGARKFDKSRISPWKGDKTLEKYLKTVFEKYPIIKELMNKYGYF